MALLTSRQVLEDRYSTFEIVGKPKTGKTASLVSMMVHLDHIPQPNKILDLFDLDGDGAEALISLVEKRVAEQTLPRAALSWLKLPEDGGRLRIYRYINSERKMLVDDVAPDRQLKPFIDFSNDLNTIVDMKDPHGNWRNPPTAPGCVVLDPCTALSDMIFDYMLRKRNKELGLGSKESGQTVAEGNKKYVDPQDWTALQQKIVDTIKVLKTFPCHRVVTFHEELVQETVPGNLSMQKGVTATIPERATGQILNLPLLSGKLQSSIGQHFSIILYSRYRPATKKSDSYIWITVPSESDRISIAGTRHRKELPNQMIQNFCDILD